MLTDAELASMRDTLNDSLPGTAIVQTSAWVSDGGGGGTTTWVPSGTFDCRIVPTSTQTGQEEELGDRVQPEGQYIVTLPSDAAVEIDTELLIDNRVFTVTGTGTPRTWALSQQLIVKEIA